MGSCSVMDGGLSLMLDPVFAVAAAGYNVWIGLCYVCKQIGNGARNAYDSISNFIKNNFFSKDNNTTAKPIVSDTPDNSPKIENNPSPQCR